MFTGLTSMVIIINTIKLSNFPYIEHLCQYGLSFLWKNNIIEPKDDRDHYPCIIWYIWKVRNDKLFRGIDRDPSELVRYAESKCHVRYNAKETILAPTHEQIVEEPEALILSDICMVDGSWTSIDQFSGIG